MRRILWLALVAVSCISAGPTLISFQQPAPAATAQDAAEAPPPSSSKIWVGRNAEFEEFLRTAEIERTTTLDVGVWAIKRAYFKPGGLVASAALRSIRPGRSDRFWESDRAEIAAYKLDRLLELDMVPPTVERRYNGEIVSLQLWGQNLKMLKEVQERPSNANLDAYRFQLRRQKVFHNLTGNLDPNQGNIMFDPVWNVVLVDFSRAFTNTRKLVFEANTIDQPFFDRIKALDRDTLRREIGDFVEGGSVDAVLARRDDIVKAFERLAKQKGASQVFLPQQPEPPPVFRVQVDAVEIDASVTDAQGNPVTDLTADDFEVLEDGRRQTITSFAHLNLPIERAERPLHAPTAIEPDVQRNDGAEGRLYVIAFDEVPGALALRTRFLLRRFIEQRFGENDRAAVVSLGRSRAADAQDFTNNRRLLLNAIDRFTGGWVDAPETPQLAEFVDTQGGNPPTSPSPGVNLEAITRARIATSAFRQLAEFMATINGRRKAMLFISTGVPINMFDVVDNYGAVMSAAGEEAREGVRAALRGNVAIYPIDPRGLTVEGGSGEATARATAGQLRADGGRESLRALADVTGGSALTNSNNFDGAFERIVRENSAYYVLGFQSTNERRDGRYRRIRVRVNRPGVQVRARDGYLAPTNRSGRPERPRLVADVNPAISDALASPLGVSALPMSIFTASYKGEGRNAAVAVAVEIGPVGIVLPEKDGTFTGQLEVVHAATAANGRLFPGDRHSVNLALRPETYDQVRQNGIRVLLQPQLPPGRYQVRVAAGFSGGRTGSVVADLEVPDFSRQPLMISGVSFTSAAAGGALSMRIAEPLAGIRPGPITAAREFDAGDTITLYTEVYENLQNAAVHTVDLKVELRTDEGRVVSTTEEERSSSEVRGRSSAYGFVAEVPLDDLEPGLYVIHVETRANMGERPSVSRDIQIRVR